MANSLCEHLTLQAKQLDWKQAARTRAMQNAYQKAQAAHPRENAPTSGQIRNLGLLDKSDDSKVVLGTK